MVPDHRDMDRLMYFPSVIIYIIIFRLDFSVDSKQNRAAASSVRSLRDRRTERAACREKSCSRRSNSLPRAESTQSLGKSSACIRECLRRQLISCVCSSFLFDPRNVFPLLLSPHRNANLRVNDAIPHSCGERTTVSSFPRFVSKFPMYHEHLG